MTTSVFCGSFYILLDINTRKRQLQKHRRFITVSDPNPSI